MMISIEMTVALLCFFVGLLVLAVVLLMGRVARQGRRLRELERILCNEPVVGHRIEAALSERATIAQWREELSKHPEGSPKHTAYLNRLREVGAL